MINFIPMKDLIRSIISASVSVKEQILRDEQMVADMERAVGMIVTAIHSGKRLWFCGNGGSAADAQHLAAEFSGRFYTDRRALPAEALHCNSSYPCKTSELNLNCIKTLKERYNLKDVGFSNHDMRVIPTIASIYKGATYIETYWKPQYVDQAMDKLDLFYSKYL